MSRRAIRLLLPCTGVMYASFQPALSAGSVRHLPAAVSQQVSQGAALPRSALLRIKRSFRTAAAQADQQAQGPPQGLPRSPFDPDYENFVALTGTMDHAHRQDNGDYCFTLSVRRQQQQQPPGTPDKYEPYQVVVPGELANTVQAEVQRYMLLQVLGKLHMDEQYKIKILATDVDIIYPTAPEELAKIRREKQLEQQQQPYLEADQQQEEYEEPAGVAAAPPPPPPAAPAVAAPLPVTGGIPVAPGDEREAMWLDLFHNPSSWWDNRSKKIGKQPDFRRKSGEGALWIDNRQTPAWVLQNLQQLPGGKPYTPPAAGSSHSSRGLPQATSAAAHMDFLPAVPGNDKEAAWIDVFANYKNWWDNRSNKRNPKAPDFKQKQGETALWLSSYDTPHWVLQHVETALPQPPPPRT